MQSDRRCPDPTCRQRFQTLHGAVDHYHREHADVGKWRVESKLVTDGSGPLETDISPRERVRALEICVVEEQWNRAEDALLDLLGTVRQRRAEARQEVQT